jgi:hypothetical protein
VTSASNSIVSPLRFALSAALAFGPLALGCTSEDAPPPPVPEPVAFQIVSPGRAAFVSSSNGNNVEVKGVGASPGLTFNGKPLPVAADGSFETTLVADEGLNVMQAEDSSGSLASAFLFGRFIAPDKAIPGAVKVRINPEGFKSSDASVASISRLAGLAFGSIDLLAALKGKTFMGTFSGGSWSFAVKSATYGGSTVQFTPQAGGGAFIASLSNVDVKGVLSVDFAYTQTDNATIHIDAAIVSGDIEAGLSKGALAVSGSNITTKFNGFTYDSNNAGFPCCVDDILSKFMKSNVEAAVQEKVAEVLASKVAFALNDFGLPESIDLSSKGFPVTLGIEQAFDGASFTENGAELSASLRFSATAGAGARALGAPGWLELGSKPLALGTSTPHAISIALDALNQALFAVWSADGLTSTRENVASLGKVTLAPKLPPVLKLTNDGKIEASAGEVFMNATIGGKPVVASVSVVQVVEPVLDGDKGALRLSPSQPAEVYVSWLKADDVAPAVKALLEALVKEQIPDMLASVTFPLPSVPLANFAPSLAGTVAAVSKDAVISLDANSNRARIEGALVLVPAN